jgi:ion channel-forming bestrophin family protein
MFIKRNIPWTIILKFGWRNLLIFTAWSTACVLFNFCLKPYGIGIMIPFAPVSLIGIAVSFLLGFKNNQSHDRFWEARTIWGSIVNGSRNFGNQVLHLFDNKGTSEMNLMQKRLIYRQIAFVNALRLTLRRPSSFSINQQGSKGNFYYGASEQKDWENDVKPFLMEEEYEKIKSFQNIPTHILKNQGADLKACREKFAYLEELAFIETMTTIKDMYADQGKCERIKNTPFPRQYAYFSKIFVWILVTLLPFALINEFDKIAILSIWAVIPFSVLISWIFLTVEIIGDNSEDPFENFINDVPMSAICRTIEIDLREMLSETDIPKKLMPVDGVLL